MHLKTIYSFQNYLYFNLLIQKSWGLSTTGISGNVISENHSGRLITWTKVKYEPLAALE